MGGLSNTFVFVILMYYGPGWYLMNFVNRPLND
jgi:hypothetical protein